MKFGRIATALATSLLLGTSAAQADPVKWYLVDWEFEDGSTASGSFVFDIDIEPDDPNYFTEVAITSDIGPTTFDFDGFADSEQLAFVTDDRTQVDLTGTPALIGELPNGGGMTNAGGTIDLVLDGGMNFNSSQVVCDDSDCYTSINPIYLVSGSISTEPPLPETPIAVEGELDFGPVQVGTEEVETFNIASLATVPLTIEGIDIDGAPAGVYELGPIALPTNLGVGEDLDFDIKFKPDVPGPYDARLKISYFAESEPENVRQVIERLTGFGLDFAEIELTEYAVHEVSKAKLKECATDGVGGKIGCSNVKKGDVAALLCGREASNDEKLALYTPCPLDQFFDPEFEGLIGTAFVGVWNKETRENACTIEPIGIELETAQVHIKDAAINQIEAVIFGEIAPYDFSASANINMGEVKKTDTILDGRNCASKFRTKSLVGEKFGVENDAVIESGKIKAGKAKDAILGAEIVDEICGIDCEEL